jgi:hypothetical protein
MTLNMAVVVPIPKLKTKTAVIVNPGELNRRRMVRRNIAGERLEVIGERWSEPVERCLACEAVGGRGISFSGVLALSEALHRVT